MRRLLPSRSSTLFLSCHLFLRSAHPAPAKLCNPSWVLLGFNNPFSSCSSSAAGGSSKTDGTSRKKPVRSMKDASLLEKLRMRHLQGASKVSEPNKTPQEPSKLVSAAEKDVESGSNEEGRSSEFGSGFRELGLSEEVMGVVEKTGMATPTEIQCVGIPAILERKSVLLSSPSGSGKTLAYLLPLIQLLRQDGWSRGKNTKPTCPRAVILLPTAEQSLQAFCMAEFFTHDIQFQPIMVTDEGQPLGQEDSSEVPIDMVVGTPGGVFKYTEARNMVYSDIRYLVLDQIDSMCDFGLGPDISKFLDLLNNHTSLNDPGLQAILVTAPVTKMLGKQLNPFVQRLEHDHSGEVAAMMLEMEQSEVYHLIESPDALKAKVAEAMASFRPAATTEHNK